MKRSVKAVEEIQGKVVAASFKLEHVSFYSCSAMLLLFVSDPFYLTTSIFWFALGTDNYTRKDYIEDAYRHSPEAHIPLAVNLSFIAAVCLVARLGLASSTVRAKNSWLTPILSTITVLSVHALSRVQTNLVSASCVYSCFLLLCILFTKALELFGRKNSP
jgi:cytochrome bd-type quinol oxidase subunit 2